MGWLVWLLCLVAYGMGDVTLYVGENLSYENEKIFHASAADLTEYRGDALSVVTACNEKALPLPAVHGICDEEFLRGKAPMTKEEVRTVSLSKLRLQEDSVCYDVGAGTGSVSVEMALRAWKGQVYAIEKKEDALALLKENRRKFATDNLEIVPGTAPEAMVELPVPDTCLYRRVLRKHERDHPASSGQKSGSTDRDQLHHPGDGDGSHECHTRFQPDGCGYRTAVCGKIKIYRKVSYDDG